MIASAPAPRARYLSSTDTARLVRAALRDAFPDGRFSVRTSYYSGGSSIRVRYVDGPPTDKVRAIVDSFSGRGFDGSIDLAYSIDAYIDADNRVLGTRTTGTAGSGGYVPAHDDGPILGTDLVSLGGGYLFVDRILSPDADARRDAWIRNRYGVDVAHHAPLGAYDHADAAIGDLPFGRS